MMYSEFTALLMYFGEQRLTCDALGMRERERDGRERREAGDLLARDAGDVAEREERLAGEVVRQQQVVVHHREVNARAALTTLRRRNRAATSRACVDRVKMRNTHQAQIEYRHTDKLQYSLVKYAAMIGRVAIFEPTSTALIAPAILRVSRVNLRHN